MNESKIRWLIVLLAALAFAPTLWGRFVYEDYSYMATVGSSLWTGWSFGPDRWLSVFTLRLNYFIAGPQPWSFHLVNVLWHLGNGLMLERAVRRIASRSVALVAMAIFLLSPLQSEAVAYVSSRTELVMVSGVLMALLALPLTVRRFPLLIAGMLVAFGSKEVGAVVVILVPLWLWFTMPMSKYAKSYWLAGGSFALLLASLRIVALPFPPSEVQHPWLGFLSIQCLALWRFIAMVFVPVGMTIDHDWDVVPHVFAVLALALTLWATFFSVLMRHRAPMLALSVLGVFVSVLPRLMIPAQGEYLNEHQMYLPMVWISLGLGVFLVAVTTWCQRFSAAMRQLYGPIFVPSYPMTCDDHGAAE